MLILALVFALILDSGRVWLAKFLRVGIFVPYAVPVVIAALMWGYLYGKDFGPFADIADKLGKAPPNFLGDQAMLFSLANVATWTYTGYNMIILYAALRSIPTELYEAAAVDGAGPVSTAMAHQAAAAAPGAAAVHDLLGHRLVPAVRGAAHLLLDRPRRDRQVLHAEPLRLQPGVRRSAPQLRGRPVVHARGRRLRDLVRRHVRVPAAGGETMSAVPAVTADTPLATRRHEGPRQRPHRAPGTRQGLRVPDAVHAGVPRLLPDAALVAARLVDEVDRRPVQLVRAVVLGLQLRRQRQRDVLEGRRHLLGVVAQHAGVLVRQRDRRGAAGRHGGLRVREVRVPWQGAAVLVRAGSGDGADHRARDPDVPDVQQDRPHEQPAGDHPAVAGEPVRDLPDAHLRRGVGAVRADRGGADRRRGRVPHLPQDRLPAARAGLRDRPAVHVRGDVEQLLPPAGDALGAEVVPAHRGARAVERPGQRQRRRRPRRSTW